MKTINKDYDFDMIISSEDLKRNQQKMNERAKVVKKRRVLKRWVKNVLWIMLGAFIGIAMYQLFTVHNTYETPVGNYTCDGGLIKVCTGSHAVANYLG